MKASQESNKETPDDDKVKNDPRVKTVTPDNENGDPGPPQLKEDSSNTGKGPKGEDL